MPEETAVGSMASLDSLLLECGFLEDPARIPACDEVFCDTWDGRLMARGYRLFHRAQEERWHLDRGQKRLASQKGSLDAALGDGPVTAIIRKRLAGRTLIPHLVVHREERLFRTSGRSRAVLELRWQKFSYGDPHGKATAPGPRVLILEGNLEGEEERDAVEILLRRLDPAAQSDFNPLEEGLRGLELPLPWLAPDKAQNVRGDDDPSRATARFLGRQAAVLRSRRRGAILDLDVEYVHQLRVAARRSRALLRLFAKHLDPQATETLLAELSWLGRALGPSRDLDVLIPALEADATGMPFPEAVTETILEAFRLRRDRTLEATRRVLGSDRFDALVEHMETRPPASRIPRDPLDTPGRTLARVGPKRVLRELGKLRRRLEQDSYNDAELHRVRIGAKRLRYSLGVLDSLVPGALTRETRHLTRIQDCLGEVHDADVASGFLRGLGRALGDRGRTEEVMAVGAFLRAQHDRKHRAREKFLVMAKDFSRFDKQLTRTMKLARRKAKS